MMNFICPCIDFNGIYEQSVPLNSIPLNMQIMSGSLIDPAEPFG